MNYNEQLAQSYLDALVDPQCFCEGRPFGREYFATTPERITNEPTCAMRHHCAMFRSPSFRGTIRMWNAHGTAEKGCDGYVAWQREKKFQEEQDRVDSMAWEITMADRKFEVKKTTLQMAVFHVAVQLIRDGMPKADVMQLIDSKSYSVREL